MNARVIANAATATMIAPTISIHGLSPYLSWRCGCLKPATCGSDGRCGYTGRSNVSFAVGVASRGGLVAAIGGPHIGGAITGAPGAGAPGSVVASGSIGG